MNKSSLRSQFIERNTVPRAASALWFQLRRRMLLLEPLSSFKKDKERHCVQCFTWPFFHYSNCWMLKTLHLLVVLVCVYVWREGRNLGSQNYFYFPCKFLHNLAFHRASHIYFCVIMSLFGAFITRDASKIVLSHPSV